MLCLRCSAVLAHPLSAAACMLHMAHISTTVNSTDIYQLLCPAISTGTNYHPLRLHQTGHPAVQRRQQDAHLARLPRDADVLLRAAGGGGAALEARWRRGAVRPVQEGERSPVGANGGGTALLPGENQLGAGAPQVSGRERSRDRGLHCHQAITVASFKTVQASTGIYYLTSVNGGLRLSGHWHSSSVRSANPLQTTATFEHIFVAKDKFESSVIGGCSGAGRDGYAVVFQCTPGIA